MKASEQILAVVAVAIVVVAAAAVAVWWPRGDGSDSAAEPEYPDGVTGDLSEGVLSYSEETVWHIYDLMESYYVRQGGSAVWAPYEGYDVVASSIRLDPGVYRVSVGSGEFDVTVPGTVERTAEWSYDYGGTVFAVSVTYYLDVEEVSAQRDRSVEFNSGDGKGSFSNLPEMVEVTPSVVALESALAEEFLRIGGSVDDRQGYADFLASFPQLAVAYPASVSGTGTDYALYGEDEYWARPLETMWRQCGDCEDTAALLCALYAAAGYQTAMGGYPGHVFAGVALDGFEETSPERLKEMDRYRTYRLACSVPVEGTCDGELAETVFYAVETIFQQAPAGYLTNADCFGMNTRWGVAGFYPVV